MLNRFFQTDNRKLLRFRLILSVLCVVIAIAVILVSVQLMQTRHNEKEFSVFVVKNVAGIEKKKLQNLISEIEGTLRVFRDWGASGLLDIKNPSALNAKFFPIFKQHPIIQALIFADSTGREYMIIRADKGLNTLQITSRDGNDVITAANECTAPEKCQELSMISAAATAVFTKEIAGKALAHGDIDDIQWSGPVRSSITKGPAVGATLTWKNPADPEILCSFSIIVNLDEIFGTVQSEQTSSQGIPFLVENETWNVLVKPQEFAGCEISGKDRKVGTRDVLGHVVSQWKQSGKIPEGPFSFTWMGKKWWIAISPLSDYADTHGHRMWVGTLIPESDMRELLSPASNTPMFFYLLVLIAGASVIAWLMWKYGRALTGRDAESGAVTSDKVLDLIKQGEGERVEFKSTMRKNLHTEKFGKEIELAWLKTLVSFMNSKGGTLLIGVDDSGGIVGLDDDEFENDDRCGLHFKNLVNQHIGAEFFPYLDFSICDVGGKKVVVVRARTSDRPVFLTVGKDEAFWVRSGPSNMKLSVSKALQYIETRKKQGKK